ncbi:MAG: TolC family protein [Gammaproteobacteria bacterium]|nr:TolC family protein [Gammaproteobacteria bacterium]
MLLLAGCSAVAQEAATARPLQAIVDEYVREALASNLALRSQSFDIERQLAVLEEARSRFLPQVGLDARYSWADGGREIELPVSDLVNPAYRTLNELLVSNGQAPRFTDVADNSFVFLREQEQDTRLTLRQPLYAPAIPAAFRAQRATLDGTTYARQALARRLERDVTVSYLDWLRARSSLEIVASSLELLQENLRVNNSLYANGRVTQDQVLRARAELLEVQQQLNETTNLTSRSQQLVNFLLNRVLDSPLEVASIGSPDAEWTKAARVDDDRQLRSGALDRRPELRELEALERAAEFQVQQERSARKPQVSIGVDGGIQGEDYDFGSDYNFGIASIQLTLPLFDGGAIRSRVDAARAVARQAAVRREETARQIELEVQQSLDRLRTAADSLATAEARAEAARAGFRIASSKRDLGVINQVVFLDARNALTGAELNLNLTRFALLSRQAELAYATAVNPLQLPDGAPTP